MTAMTTQVRRGHHLGKLEIQLTLEPISQEEYDQVLREIEFSYILLSKGYGRGKGRRKWVYPVLPSTTATTYKSSWLKVNVQLYICTYVCSFPTFSFFGFINNMQILLGDGFIRFI